MNIMALKEAVINKLQTVIDPETNVGVVRMRLVNNLEIDENGKAQQSGTPWVPVGSWNFDSPENKPSGFKLTTKPLSAQKTEKIGAGQLVDFGKETFGYIKIHGLKGKGKVALYDGESREEALDTARCETLDYLSFDGKQPETGMLCPQIAFSNRFHIF